MCGPRSYPPWRKIQGAARTAPWVAERSVSRLLRDKRLGLRYDRRELTLTARSFVLQDPTRPEIRPTFGALPTVSWCTSNRCDDESRPELTQRPGQRRHLVTTSCPATTIRSRALRHPRTDPKARLLPRRDPWFGASPRLSCAAARSSGP